MRTFGQTPTKIWRDKTYRALTDDGKLAFHSLWCGPHSTSAGVFVLEDDYGAVTLDWPVERWQKARKELEDKGLIRRNEGTDEIIISGFFDVNRPVNARARAAVEKQIAAVQCTELRKMAQQAFAAVSVVTEEMPPEIARLNTSHLSRGTVR